MTGIQQDLLVGIEFQYPVMTLFLFCLDPEKGLEPLPGISLDGITFTFQVFTDHIGTYIGKLGKFGNRFKSFFNTFLNVFGNLLGQFHFYISSSSVTGPKFVLIY